MTINAMTSWEELAELIQTSYQILAPRSLSRANSNVKPLAPSRSNPVVQAHFRQATIAVGGVAERGTELAEVSSQQRSTSSNASPPSASWCSQCLSLFVGRPRTPAQLWWSKPKVGEQAGGLPRQFDRRFSTALNGLSLRVSNSILRMPIEPGRPRHGSCTRLGWRRKVPFGIWLRTPVMVCVRFV